jgi:hypothetical protein
MRIRLIGGAAVLAAIAAGVTYAAVPDSGGVIHACYADGKGDLRVLVEKKTGAACGKRETPLSWNQVGPKGDKGEKGDAGPAGPQGPEGPAGPGSDFTAGIGLDKLTLTAPPPIGDQTQVQISQGYRLPQACAAGSVPQKSGSGPGWLCGSGGAGASVAVVRWGSSGIDNVTGSVPLAVDLEAGAWAITAAGTIENLDRDDAGTCTLYAGAEFLGATSWELENTDYIGGVNMTILGAVAAAAPTNVRVACRSVADGTKAEFRLLAIRVGAIG